MSGLIVTWDEEEMHVIEEDEFEAVVVDVVEEFFDAVEGYSEVVAEWETPTRDHDSVYKVSEPPLIHLDRSRCFINIEGQQRGGQYQLDLKPSGFEIKTLSTGRREELTSLRLRPEGLAIDPDEKEAFLETLPEAIKERVIDPILTD